MISAEAKNKFLNRELENFDWLKQLKEPEIDKLLSGLKVKPKFVTPPYLHQKICFYIGANKPNFLFMLDAGTGKSKLTLDLIRYHKMTGHAKRALVVVPRSAHIENWEDEVKVHQPKMSFCPLYESTNIRAHTISRSLDTLSVINYAGLVRLATTYQKESKNSKRGGLVIDPKKIMWLHENFDMSVFDESHNIKNWNSLQFKVSQLLSGKARIRYALTGTPLDKDEHDFWAQFYMVDRGATLGPHLNIFREVFFKTKQNHWGSWEHKFNKNMDTKFHEVLRNRSIWYSEDECGTLPEKVFIKRRVELPTDIADYYKLIIKRMKEAGGDKNALDLGFMQLRMLSSGFIQFKDAEGGKDVITFQQNPKLDELICLVQSLPKGSKMIVFNQFIHSGKIISDTLTKIGVKNVRLYSGTKDQAAVVKSFKKDPSVRVLVANDASGGEGLNLQVANYTVFFEQPLSYIRRRQCIKRTNRNGQTKDHCFYYDLLMRGTPDERIHRMVKKGSNLYDRYLMEDLIE